jgi:hypothetical protein
MTAEQAVERLQVELAHLWMVRTFLKHAEEIQDDEEMLDVPRTLFDCIRATEPAALANDTKEFLHRARSKLSKLRKAAEYFEEHYRDVTDHTNWQMASASLTGSVRRIEEILGEVAGTPS